LKRLFLVVFCALSVAGFGGAIIAADMPASVNTGQTMHAVMKTGDYRDLTFLRKVKLGTAPFVNPQLLGTAAVAYRYRHQDIAAAEDLEQLVRAMSDGTAWIANESNDNIYKVIGVDAEDWGFSYAELSNQPGFDKAKFDWMKAFAGPDEVTTEELAAAIDQWMSTVNKMEDGGVTFHFVSTNDALLGLKPDSAIVSWYAKGVVMPIRQRVLD